MNRIAEIRKLRKMTMAQLGAAVGTEATTINKLEKGQIRLSVDWLEKIAAALKVSVAELISQAPPPEPIEVRGKVQAGNWTDAIEWEHAMRYPVWVPVPDQWKSNGVFGLEVHGPSMNRRYPEGTILLCVPFVPADIEPRESQRYIVQRERAGEYEMTVKELRFDKAGKPWLWPDSDDPDHQQPLAVQGDDGDTIEIVALVIASFQPETSGAG